MLLGKADILKEIALLTFDAVQMTPADSIKNLGVITEPNIITGGAS